MSKCVFLHVPKTGGTWATRVLRDMGAVQATLNAADGGTHPTLAIVKGVFPNLPVITSVRHPVSWLRSFWKFYHRRAWRPGGGVDDGPEVMRPLLALESPDFQQFAEKYLARKPGYVTELFQQYLDGSDFVCRQEHLAADLATALRKFEQPFCEGVLWYTPAENASYPFDTSCTPEVEQQLLDADHTILEKYYKL